MRTVARVLLALLPFAGLLPSQQGSAAGFERVPIHSAAAGPGSAGRQDYGIWAAGRSYKASFHGRMTFVPYLGADYPVSRPWSWRTSSVRRGGIELLASGSLPAPETSDYRCEYRFGVVTEAYDVRADGLEQTFVFEHLPGSGDLRIRGVLTTELTAAVTSAAHGALSFVDVGGTPVLNYGAGVAFDATGRSVDVLTGFEDGTITLTVPGAWLETAALPVVVDPLISAAPVSGAGVTGVVREVDVARDGEAAVASTMIVETRAASAGDHDLFAYLVDDNFTNQGLVFSDVTSSWNADSPSCAFVGGADRWVIVFRRSFNGVLSRIVSHVHDSDSTAFSTALVELTPPTGHNDWRPDVGGVQAFEPGANALVVFQRENNNPTAGFFANTDTSSVHASVLDVGGRIQSFGTPFLVAGSPLSDSERPSVNRIASSSGARYSWVCVFQAYTAFSAPDDWDLIGRRIDETGVMAPGLFTSSLGTGNPRHQMAPVVEGSAGRYAVAFSASAVISLPPKPAGRGGNLLFVERFDWPENAPSPTGSHGANFLTGDPNPDLEITGLAHDTSDRSHWAVQWRGALQGTAGTGSYYTIVGFTGEATESGTVVAPGAARPSPVASVFDEARGEYSLAWSPNLGQSPPSTFAARLRYANAPLWANAGSACTSAAIEWLGNQQIGAEFNGVVVRGAPANAGHFLLASFAPADLPVIDPAVVPGCRLLVDVGPAFVGTLVFQLGSTPFWQIALPEWLPPTTLHFQDWILAGPQLVSTQRLSVDLVK